MENKSRVGSSSSFTNDLFGAKESSPSSASAGIFSSILQSPPRVGTKDCPSSELIGSAQKQFFESHTGNIGSHGDMIKNKEDGASRIYNRERTSIFLEKAEPCPLSSSIYYGGQEDMYVQTSSAQKSESYPIQYKKDGGQDDPSGNNSQGASRGNWWQGSLYY